MASKKRSTKSLRGRPPTGQAMTAAERMRRLRERRRAVGLKPVVAWVAREAPTRPGYSSHRLLDARSLAMHVVIAQKIERDPKLLDVARNNLKRWRARWDGEAPAWHQQWSAVLARPWTEIAAFMTEFSERAVQLRQSSPFAGVLSPAERKKIYEAFRA
jgi:hypothetical protein